MSREINSSTLLIRGKNTLCELPASNHFTYMKPHGIAGGGGSKGKTVGMFDEREETTVHKSTPHLSCNCGSV